jgi:hypothetical protein
MDKKLILLVLVFALLLYGCAGGQPPTQQPSMQNVSNTSSQEEVAKEMIKNILKDSYLPSNFNFTVKVNATTGNWTCDRYELNWNDKTVFGENYTGEYNYTFFSEADFCENTLPTLNLVGYFKGGIKEYNKSPVKSVLDSYFKWDKADKEVIQDMPQYTMPRYYGERYDTRSCMFFEVSLFFQCPLAACNPTFECNYSQCNGTYFITSIYMVSNNLTLSCGAVREKVASPSSQQAPQKKPCDTINRNPPEMTFELSYCQGDMCSRICDENGGNCHTPTKEECEKIDVIKGEDITKWGQDGIPDCEWVQGACIPNK